MGKERHMVIPSVLVMLKREDKVLLLRRAHSGFQDGQYTFPSGHVESGEPATLGGIREVVEEVGVEVMRSDLKFEQLVYRRGFNDIGDGYNLSQPERIDIIFSTELWEGEPKVMEPDKSDEVRWVSLQNIPENIFPVVGDFLKAYPNHPPFRELGY